MQSIIDNPRAALGAGLVLTAAILLVWLIAAGADGLGARLLPGPAACTCWPP